MKERESVSEEEDEADKTNLGEQFFAAIFTTNSLKNELEHTCEIKAIVFA